MGPPCGLPSSRLRGPHGTRARERGADSISDPGPVVLARPRSAPCGGRALAHPTAMSQPLPEPARAGGDFEGAIDRGLEGVVTCTTAISTIAGTTLLYRGYTIEDL